MDPEAMPTYVGTDEHGRLTVLGNESNWDGRPIEIELAPPWSQIMLGDKVLGTFPSYRHACDAYAAATQCVELYDVEQVLEFASANAWNDVNRGDAVYITHFLKRYKHAGHYVGSTGRDLDERIREHRNGTPGQGLMAVIKANDIDFVVADVLHGGHDKEMYLKHVYKHTTNRCPLCVEASQG